MKLYQKLYQKIVNYVLIAALGLGTVGCDQSYNQQITTKPKYISGTIKSERFQDNIICSDTYFFTLSTEDGIKTFECCGDWSAPKMDALLDPGDKVKLRISKDQIRKQNDFSVNLDDIVEINGKPFSYHDHSSKQQMTLVTTKPKYISGTIKSERFQDNIICSDTYFFTLSTEDGIKTFECYGDWSAPKMDALLDPGDKVKLRISKDQIRKQNDFSVNLDDIVEINGKPFSH